MTLRICTLILLAAAAPVFAADQVTFTKDVLPILQENCQDCHRPGGANLGGMVAPMAFSTYQETRPWAKAIARAVTTRTMPPWDAAPEFAGHFSNERSLTQVQIDILVAWVEGGAQRGNPSDAPAPRVFDDSGEWTIGVPDLVVQMPEAYFVDDDVEDIYVNFYDELSAEELPEDRYIKAVEFRPGSAAVHHIISNPLGGIAPGNDATVYPEGYATKLRKGTKVSFEMHYHKEAGPNTGMWDQSSAAIKLYPEGYVPEHEIRMAPLMNVSFEIPAGAEHYVEHASESFDRDVQILSYTPHMHLRGKYARYDATYPDGKSETLLEVPQYDFNWQTTYWHNEPKVLPKGSSVDLTMAWDNSPANAYNPDPTKNVRFGEPTTDEMFFGFMNYAYVEEPRGVSVDASILERYVGQYKLQGDMPMLVTIGLQDGKLTAAIMGQDPTPLMTESATRFSLSDFGLVITFELDDIGDAVKGANFRLLGNETMGLPVQ